MQKAARLTVSGLIVLASLSASVSGAWAVPSAIPALLPQRLETEISLGAPATDTAAAMQIAPLPLNLNGALTVSLPALGAVGDSTRLNMAGLDPATAGDKPMVVRAASYLQCVSFARLMTGFDLYGDAKTWWAKARGLYEKLTAPKAGAVMVFAGGGRLRHGHVAVVKQIISPREVRVDHANWGNDGRVYLNAPVVDVSPNNDWTLVRVWNAQIHALGTHIYRLKGFLAE